MHLRLSIFSKNDDSTNKDLAIQNQLNEVHVIKRLEKITPKMYENEGDINPGYCELEHAEKLCPNQKLIWLLRSDFIIALGVKNESRNGVYSSHFENPVMDYDYLSKFHFGHPTLAVPEKGFDGTGYYGGWIRQFNGYLEILLSTGRFQQKLNPTQMEAVERHVARRFMAAYGRQNVIFTDFIKGSLEWYLKNQITKREDSRIYTPEQLRPEALINVDELVLLSGNERSSLSPRPSMPDISK